MNATERDDLDAFVRRADRLGRCRIYDRDRVSVFELTLWPGRLHATATQPDEDTLTAFVDVLRPLILQRSGTSLDRVLNLCRRHLDDAELRRELDGVRAEWKAAQKNGAIRLNVDGEHWRPERVADLVINSQIAHDDHDKRRELERLGGLATVASKTVFAQYVMQTGAAARRIAEVVRIGRRDGRFR